MPPDYVNGNVRALCPDCGGALTIFERAVGGNVYHAIERPGHYVYRGYEYGKRVYQLLRCAGCGRGGLATILADGGPVVMSHFYPMSVKMESLPNSTPAGVLAEYREAEQCAGIGAWRAASALLRSALEKTLIANGYTKGNLEQRIDAAAVDGIITASHQQRAHEDVRVLGNDILHDEWREVDSDEYEAAHHYVQRIVEDFFDTRAQVEKILTEKGRIKPAQQ